MMDMIKASCQLQAQLQQAVQAALGSQQANPSAIGSHSQQSSCACSASFDLLRMDQQQLE
jgi:hypothetical protein